MCKAMTENNLYVIDRHYEKDILLRDNDDVKLQQ